MLTLMTSEARNREDGRRRDLTGSGASTVETDSRQDEAAWKAHREMLGRFIRKRVRGDVADDLLQDVLLKAWSNRDRLDDEMKLSAWLFRIARNVIADHYRSRGTEGGLGIRFENAEAEGESEPAEVPEEDIGLAERELANCLGPMIDRLPEPYRDAMRLAEFEGKRRHEIAELQGISLSGAKSRVGRGRERLREMLGRCCRIEVNTCGSVVDYEPRADCTTC